jgi:predicted Ser/Thr protein kinase
MSNTVKLPTCPKCGAPIPLAAPQGLCPKCVLLGAATATEQGVPATATSEIPSIERIATAFPQLEILELIGRGGMGFVFKARQPHLDRFVALKLLPDKLAKDAQFAERFNREGRVLAKLNHPNIVSVFDFGQTGGFYYLLMEYVDGVNLRQAMRAGRFSPGEALSIVPKVCEALQYAHEQGVLHRDIKPENILLDAKGRVKIADFGIAKLVGEDQPNVTLTNTGAALGTPHYMAPEQLEKPSTVDHRADIYSLGVVFYEMLTGELPIGRFAPPSAKTPVGSPVDEVVFRTLEKDRERRYQSAGEMKTQVEHLTEEGASARSQSDPARPGSPAGIPDASTVKRPAQALVAVGIFNWVGSIIVMMVLTYAGLGRQFPLSPQELGSIALLMIVFSSVILLAGLKMMRLQAYPLVILGSLLAMITTPGNIIGLPVGLWVLVTLRQPGVRAAFNQRSSVPRRAFEFSHGMSIAILTSIFLCGVIVLARHWNQNQPSQPAPVSVSPASNPDKSALEAAPMIQFTFTTVELREEEGARWLAMDFVEQTRGDCGRTLRYDNTVPGFTAQTRTTSFMTDAKAGFAPVLHQRVMWKLPDSLPKTEAEALRELVARERIGKPIILEPGEEYPLFKIVVPGGGSLVTAVGVKPLNGVSEAAQNKEVGVAKLIVAGDYQHLAVARLESVPGHPLHQIVARFAGPEISEQASRAQSAIQGPLLVPSPDEDQNTPAEPVEGSILWGPYRRPIASALSFECPGDYVLHFVLPDETLARDAAQQINKALAQPMSLRPGRPVRLFTAGEWKGWIETRPFVPAANKLTFFRHPGRSPAQIPGTNSIESTVATIPPGHELSVTGRLIVNGLNQPDAFSATLTSAPKDPGIYWFTWYSLPNPQTVDRGLNQDWVLQIHDAAGRELHRFQAPEKLKTGWQRRWPGETLSARAGKGVTQMIFEKPGVTGGRPTSVLMEMTLKRLAP